MSTLRKDAIDLVEQIPEEKLYFVVELLKGVNGLFGYAADSRVEKQKAFEDLSAIRKAVPNLDYDTELAMYRKERYGTTNIN